MVKDLGGVVFEKEVLCGRTVLGAPGVVLRGAGQRSLCGQGDEGQRQRGEASQG